MKRLHVHVSVKDLDASIHFYESLFGAAPSVVKPDYAKWMLDDPRVNFAISSRGKTAGVDHLGIQAEDGDELGELEQRMDQAALPVEAQMGTTCCYSRSDKYWTVDPQGVPWETFHSLEQVPVYDEAEAAGEEPVEADGACCAPKTNACCAPK